MSLSLVVVVVEHVQTVQKETGFRANWDKFPKSFTIFGRFP